MKVISIVGARPQFIKAAAVSRQLRERHHEILVHTGQHYDANMSEVFFDELEIPKPDLNLGIGSGLHGAQTGAMLTGIEKILLEERPDWVLVYGDTNSTIAGALASAKLNIPVAHVEAGLRSFNHAMPEEINRVLTDHVSKILFCSSQTGIDNLAAEGITLGVHMVGDVMRDTLSFALEQDRSRPSILQRLGLREGCFLLASVHRVENTDNPNRLGSILAAFDALDEPLVIPLHPRTRDAIGRLGYSPATHVSFIEPVSYQDMVFLEQSARMILTDSGGLQKEAYWLEVPCLTLRDETEWVETVEAGWNKIVSVDKEKIVGAVRTFTPPTDHPLLYGDGHAAIHIVAALETSST